MELFQAIILGLVQGLTEFLPVSSSAHLVIVRDLLNMNDSHALAFDAVLQLATIAAVGIYFWKDLWGLFITACRFVIRKTVDKKEKTLLFSVIIGTVPAVIVGLLLEHMMEGAFRDIRLVAGTLALGSMLFIFAEKYGKQNGELTIQKGLFVGFFQALAVVPGMSRSGMTISGGLLNGLTRIDAARFSFILSFPIIVGSGVKKLLELVKSGALSGDYGFELIVASIIAFVVGIGVIHFLMKFLQRHSLVSFAWYRVALATVILVSVMFIK
jgi:undecaprenyl-diphosphatase